MRLGFRVLRKSEGEIRYSPENYLGADVRGRAHWLHHDEPKAPEPPPKAPEAPAAERPARAVDPIAHALQILAGQCDGARMRDDIGFSGSDVRFGHSLAQQSIGGELTPRQRRAAKIMLMKYHRQLGDDLIERIKAVSFAPETPKPTAPSAPADAPKEVPPPAPGESPFEAMGRVLAAHGMQATPSMTARGNRCVRISGNTYGSLSVFQVLKAAGRGVWYSNRAWYAFPERFDDVTRAFSKGGKHVQPGSSGPATRPTESPGGEGGQARSGGSRPGGGDDAAGVLPESGGSQSRGVSQGVWPVPGASATARSGGEPSEGVRGRLSAKRPDYRALTVDELIKIQPPPVVTPLLPELAGILTPRNARDVQAMADAWDRGQGGFILGNGTGTGKTYCTLGLIRQLGTPRTLIVVPNQGVAEQWAAEGRNVGVTVTPRPPKDRNEEGVFCTTYAMLRRVGDEQGEWGLFIPDEIHREGMKLREGKQTAKLLAQVSRRAKMTVYSTATPFERPQDCGYLERADLWMNGQYGFKAWATDHGVQWQKRTINTPRGPMQIEDPHFVGSDNKPANKLKDMLRIRAEIVGAGKGVFRMLDIDQPLTAAFSKVPARGGEFGDVVHRAIMAVDNLPDIGLWKAAKRNLSKRLLDYVKLEAGVDAAEKAIRAGKRVAVFVSNVSPFSFERPNDDPEIGKISREIGWAFEGAGLTGELPSPTDLMVKKLRARLGADAVEAYTGAVSDTKRAKIKKDFQAGKLKAIVATIAAGGTGLSLHDTVGGAPREQINLGLPWTGKDFAQLMGRTYRVGTKSPVHQTFIMTDDETDEAIAARVAGKLESMGAGTTGVVADLTAHTLAAFDFLPIEDQPEPVVLRRASRTEDVASSQTAQQGQSEAAQAAISAPPPQPPVAMAAKPAQPAQLSLFFKGRRLWLLAKAREQLLPGFRPFMQRKKVKQPGIRGGRYWVDDKGQVRYGKPPKGVKGFRTESQVHMSSASRRTMDDARATREAQLRDMREKEWAEKVAKFKAKHPEAAKPTSIVAKPEPTAEEMAAEEKRYQEHRARMHQEKADHEARIKHLSGAPMGLVHIPPSPPKYEGDDPATRPGIGRQIWALTTRDTYPGSPGWRTSMFDDRGPYTHHVGKTPEESLADALDTGEAKRAKHGDPAKFQSFTQTPDFVQGSRWAHIRKVANQIGGDKAREIERLAGEEKWDEAEALASKYMAEARGGKGKIAKALLWWRTWGAIRSQEQAMLPLRGCRQFSADGTPWEWSNGKILCKAEQLSLWAQPGKISQGGHAQLGTDKIGRKHWIAPMEAPGGKPRPEQIAVPADAREIANSVDLTVPLPDNPAVGQESFKWVVESAKRRVAEKVAGIDRVNADQATPEDRVVKVGKKWTYRSLGSDSTCPGLMSTRKEAVDAAKRNEQVVIEMRPETLGDDLASYRADLAAYERAYPSAADDYRRNGTRAKAFLAWFGDWIKHPEQASKVLDEKGEPAVTRPTDGSKASRKTDKGRPLVVYHGSPEHFTAFNLGKAKPGLYGTGIYFTEDRTVAEGEYEERDFFTYHDTKEQAEAVPGRKGFVWLNTYSKPTRTPTHQRTGPAHLYEYEDYDHDKWLQRNNKWIANVPSRVLKRKGYANQFSELGFIETNSLARFNTLLDERIRAKSRWLGSSEREYLQREVGKFREGWITDVPMAELAKLSNAISMQPFVIPVSDLAREAGIETGGKVYACYLNIRDPFVIDQFDIDPIHKIPVTDLASGEWRIVPKYYGQDTDDAERIAGGIRAALREGIERKLKAAGEDDAPVAWYGFDLRKRRNEAEARSDLVGDEFLAWFKGKPSVLHADSPSNPVYHPREAVVSIGGQSIFDKVQGLIGPDRISRAFQLAGYDGLTHIGGVVSGGKKHRVWIAFAPNQIKAVDNEGAFDASEDDMYKAHVRAYTKINPKTGQMEQVKEHEDKRLAAQMRTPTPRAPAQAPVPAGHRFATLHGGGPGTPGQTIGIVPHPTKPGVWRIHQPQQAQPAQQQVSAPKPEKQQAPAAQPASERMKVLDPKEICPQVAGCDEDEALGGVSVPKDPERVRSMLTQARQAVAAKLKGVGDTGDPPTFANSAQTVSELIDDAAKTETLIRQLIHGAAQASAGEANFGPNGAFALKTPKSLREKVEGRVQTNGTDEKKEVSLISDAVHGTVIVDTPDQLKKAAEAIRKATTEAGGKIYIDNKWEREVVGGYAGVHADLLLPAEGGRFVRAEAQLHLRTINDGTMECIKERAHQLYKPQPGVRDDPVRAARATNASMLMYLSAMLPVVPGVM